MGIFLMISNYFRASNPKAHGNYRMPSISESDWYKVCPNFQGKYDTVGRIYVNPRV